MIIVVLFIIVPAFSQTENEFWRSQKDPLFSGEKVVLERLEDGKKEMESVPEENSQYDSYMNSESNENDRDSEYMYENMGGYEVLTSPPHRPEDLIHISTTAPSVGNIPGLANAPQVPSAPQPMTESPPVGQPLQPANLPLDGSTDCVCVEYYLCGANNTIITNGEGGLIGVRASGERQCPGVQVCCELPEEDRGSVTFVTTSPPPSSCGIRGGNLDPTTIRILTGSNPTEFGEFPWMLALLREEEGTEDGSIQYLFQCGASLIHPQAALTAAHCVSSLKERELKIRAGEWDTDAQTEPLPYQERSVSQIIKHPDYYSGALYNDISLLILDSPLTIAANVLPICLPDQEAVFDSSRCFATGWGVDAYGRGANYQTVLRKVEIPIVPSTDCQEKLRSTRLGSFFRLHDSFICAGGEPGEDTCKGDGGGPLVCQLPNASRYVQVGIVSWGIDCGMNNIPGVYTNVPRFRNWIDNLLKNLRL